MWSVPVKKDRGWQVHGLANNLNLYQKSLPGSGDFSVAFVFEVLELTNACKVPATNVEGHACRYSCLSRIKFAACFLHPNSPSCEEWKWQVE